MELPDLSDLRSTEEVIDIPLNGQRYQAMAEPPAEVVLASMNTATGGGMAAELAKAQQGGKLNLDELVEKNPVMAMQLATAGMTQTERAIHFLQAVLLPESRQRWAYYMRQLPDRVPAEPGYPADEDGMRAVTEAEAAAHRRHAITLRQCMGVYQQLMRVYAARPTVPPSSSPNGHGGAGGTSTAGAPTLESTP